MSFHVIYVSAKLISFAAQDSTRHESLLASSVVDALLWTTAHDYSFAGEGRRELLTMCVHKGRLWQLTAKAPESSWGKREALYLNVVGSFVPKL